MDRWFRLRGWWRVIELAGWAVLLPCIVLTLIQIGYWIAPAEVPPGLEQALSRLAPLLFAFVLLINWLQSRQERPQDPDN